MKHLPQKLQSSSALLSGFWKETASTDELWTDIAQKRSTFHLVLFRNYQKSVFRDKDQHLRTTFFPSTVPNIQIKQHLSNTLPTSVESWWDSGQMFLFTFHPSPSPSPAHPSSLLQSEWDASPGQHLKGPGVRQPGRKSSLELDKFYKFGFISGPWGSFGGKNVCPRVEVRRFFPLKTQRVRVLTWKEDGERSASSCLVPTGWHSGNS